MKDRLIIKDTLTIKKRIVFLCGAFFQRSKPSDKRVILTKYLRTLSKNIYPLIVDTFLGFDSIETDKYSIEQYEELISNVSFYNFIFLESFSSASELGLFTSYSSSTPNVVFYPDKSNLILDKIGAFVRYGVLKNKTVFKSVEYLAFVERYAHGTDYVDEHYYFLDNKLPEEIKKVVEEAVNNIDSQNYALSIVEKDDAPKSLSFFEFCVIQRIKKIMISIQTAFYMLYPLVISNHSFDELLVFNPEDELSYYLNRFSHIIIDTMIEKYNLQEACLYSVEVLNYDSLESFLKCALYFIKYMALEIFENKKSKSNQIALIKDIYEYRSTYHSIESRIIQIPKVVSLDNKNKLIKQYPLIKNKKRRIITTYSTPNNELYVLQSEIAESFKEVCHKYNLYSSRSFAYKEGLNTLLCVREHLNSRCFLKMDIHKFFESMKQKVVFTLLLNKFEKECNFDLFSDNEKSRFKHRLRKAVNALTYKRVFPVGFVSSPIVSEIYLSDFDKTIFDFCEKSNLIYTRYADDILISSKYQFDYVEVKKHVADLLGGLSLELNESKTKYVYFSKQGDFINYIGLNLIYSDEKTKIGLGRAFVKKLAKLKVYGSNSNYVKKKIAGLETYLKYNDNSGYQKYLDIVQKYKLLKKN